MQEITNQNDFDYSIVGFQTASKLRALSNQLDGIYQNYQVEVGGILYQAQQELANYDSGIFGNWLDSKGLKRNAYNYINAYKLLQKLQNPSEREIFLNQPKSLQYEMSKPSAKPELNQKVFDGDITTHKKYKELERQLKLAEADKERLRQQNENLAEQALKQEVVEKEVVIEKVPDDYEAIKKLNSDLLVKNQKLNNKSEEFERQIRIKEHELSQLKEDTAEAIALKEVIENLNSEKAKTEITMKNVFEISSMLTEFEEFFDSKMAPMRFKALISGLGTEIQIEKLRDMLVLVGNWLDEMSTIVPENGRRIIEGEIING